MEHPMQTAVHIETSGPFCPKCDSLIESALGGLPGVSRVRADFRTGLTSVLIDQGEVDAGRLADQIRRCGFKAHEVVVRPLEPATPADLGPAH
jgi:copper chaperone CopZ